MVVSRELITDSQFESVGAQVITDHLHFYSLILFLIGWCIHENTFITIATFPLDHSALLRQHVAPPL
jgi:hypothetical protein